LGELRGRGGDGCGGYGEFREFGVWSCHKGGVELRNEDKE